VQQNECLLHKKSVWPLVGFTPIGHTLYPYLSIFLQKFQSEIFKFSGCDFQAAGAELFRPDVPRFRLPAAAAPVQIAIPSNWLLYSFA
jgi:hypothetical protein